jgi:hypothetical protein
MKIKILPNWYKKTGFSMFIFGFIISGYSGFYLSFQEGLNGEEFGSREVNKLFEGEWIHLFDILAISGMVIYMFSKEKTEDEYINKLRLESFQLTSFIGLAITIISYALSEEIELTLDYFIILFLWIYLMIFAIKKRT